MPKSQNSGGYVVVEQENQYVNITSATTTVCIIGKGFLHNIVINTTAAGTITVYDDTSAVAGSKIGTIAASAVVGSNFQYNVELKRGLTIVTGAASDITVSCKDNN